MKHYARKVRETLFDLIHETAQIAWLFSKNPGKDFTRTRKLDFAKIVSILLAMEGGTLTTELLRYFKCSDNMPTTSAFVQQRSKLRPEAMEFIFRDFANSFPGEKLYRGYRLLATDGSDIQLPTDETDPETYYVGEEGKKPYNITKLNALYDLCNHLYVDAIVQGKRICNENKMLAKMVDRSSLQGPVILIADRGFESYNSMVHVQRKGWKYLIRAKDVRGIVYGLDLPKQEEFDVPLHLMLTRKQTKEVKALLKGRNHYRFIPYTANFEFLPHSGGPLFYEVNFRVARFKISENSFETVVTNLDPNQIPPSELKKLYAMRWGIETSFRKLKYTLGLLSFHAKKVEHILQEIFARLIMYNFTELITSHAVIQKKDRKYAYQANFSAAVHICRQFLRGDVSPPRVEALISRFISPIRPGRSSPRKLNGKEPVSFFYRAA